MMNTSIRRWQNGIGKSFGALSLCFFMAATAQGQDAPIPSGTTLSTLLKDIEDQANATSPAHRVIIIDTDALNTQAADTPFPSLKQRLANYLATRGLTLGRDDRSAIYWSLGGSLGPGSRNPQALHITAHDRHGKEMKVCIVSPETGDLSSRSLIEAWIGKAGPNHLQAAIDPGPYAMAVRVAWHEAWHCMDKNFVQAYQSVKQDQGFDFALAIHRAEMFADVAATLTMARDGNLDIMQQTADARAINTRWMGPGMMIDYSPDHDPEYYAGLTYYTTPAHDAALAHIQAAGPGAVRHYTLADIERIATDITLKHALTAREFRNLADYLKNGNAHKRALSARAAQGDGAARQDLDVIDRFEKRTTLAKANLTIETKKPVTRQPDTIPPTAAEILHRASKKEKDAVFRALEHAIRAARAGGMTARQGVYNQLEEWRQDLHADPARRDDLERKLFLAGLMLSQGQLDGLLLSPAPAATPAAPRAA